MRTSSILVIVWVIIAIAASFAFIYLALNFFKKQEYTAGKLSQRLMCFLLDMFSLNVLTFVIGIIVLIKMGNVSETVTDYILTVQKETGSRFWYDFGYLQMILTGIYAVYSTVCESLNIRGTLGRIRSDLAVVSSTGETLSIGAVILRNILKFAFIIPALYFGGLKGLIILLIFFYVVYRLSKSGKLLHDYLGKSKVVLVEEELKEIKAVPIV